MGRGKKENMLKLFTKSELISYLLESDLSPRAVAWQYHQVLLARSYKLTSQIGAMCATCESSSGKTLLAVLLEEQERKGLWVKVNRLDRKAARLFRDINNGVYEDRYGY